MSIPTDTSHNRVSQPEWYSALARYEKPHTARAVWQLTNTLVPYVGIWALLVWMLRAGVSYWYALPLILIAAGLLVRVFIFFHDCCHGSFFRSHRANVVVGVITGILTFTPYEDWQHTHAGHHAASGDLDRRGIGDVWTLTVDEYLAAPWWKRLAYRVVRNPVVLFVFASALMFLVIQRFPHHGARKRERRAVLVTNLALVGIAAVAAWTIGLHIYLMIQLPIMCTAGAIGVWLFYVQHQFEGDYWERHADWDPIKAALEGSSYYKLPAVLQWFSGNIGLHHIHHLRPRIPNYNLQRCYDETPALQAVTPLTLRRSLTCIFLNLWDESAKEMVSFRAIRRRRLRTA